MTDMNSSSTAAAGTAAAKPAATPGTAASKPEIVSKPVTPASASASPASPAAAVVPDTKLPASEPKRKPKVGVVGLSPENYDPKQYGGAKLAIVKLLREGIMQFDSQYRIKVDSADEEGTLIPFTPFFASRVGTLIDIIEIVNAD